MTAVFRLLPARLGEAPGSRERAAYEAASAQLLAMPRPWPRFLASPGVAVAVLEARAQDGSACTGLVVELSR